MILSLGDALSGLPSPSPRYSDWDCASDKLDARTCANH